MNPIQCRAVLLDIEGTVSPVAFVFDVMFPYARDNAADFLKSNWNEQSVQDAVQLLATDAGHENADIWLSDKTAEQQQATVCQTVHDLMDRDAKVTGLKQLQGLIWRTGFESGSLVSELFTDVHPKMKEWKTAGLDLYIYSSGSIGAQKLFFRHTVDGNLLDLLSGHFDTTSGNKKETESYKTIASEMGLPANAICFISDVLAEVDAAKAAGMQTVIRPAENEDVGAHLAISSFAEIEMVAG